LTVAQMAPFLGGRQYELTRPADAPAMGHLATHVTTGNQDISTYDGVNNLSATQLAQRISMIDQVLAALPGADNAAQDALQQQRNELMARLSLQ
jgi:hypothetical protein